MIGFNAAGTVAGLKRSLRQAGAPARIEAHDVMAVKLAFALVGLAVGFLLAFAWPNGLSQLALAVGPLAGFFLPDFLLARRASKRRDEACAELPDLLDLMRVAVEAGQPLQRAISYVCSYHNGPLATELEKAAAKGKLGAPLGQSLAELKEGFDSAEVQLLVTSIERSTKHGSALGQVLERQAREAREARYRAVRERAAKAGPKIQLVVALLLVPAVLLLFAAVLVARLMQSTGGSTIFGW